MLATQKLPVERPFPTQGEILKVIVTALGTKQKNKKLDRLALEGDFEYSLPEKLIDELVYNPLKKYCNEELAEFFRTNVQNIIREYMTIVSSVSLGSSSRAESFPILIKNLFCKQSAEMAHDFHGYFGGVKPELLLDMNTSVFNSVFVWAQEHVSGFDQAFSSLQEEEKKLFMRWSSGKTVPQLSSIKLLVEKMVKRDSINKSDGENLKKHLLVSRVICSISSCDFGGEYITASRQFLNTDNNLDIRLMLDSADSKVAEELSELYSVATDIERKLDLSLFKNEGDKGEVALSLNLFESDLGDISRKGVMPCLLEWYRGRWNLLSGDHKQAKVHYESAVQLSLYRTARFSEILSEALPLAAKMQDKVFMNRLKNQALAFGIYKQPELKASEQKGNVVKKNALVQKWEVEAWQNAFSTIFPDSGCFPDNSDIELHVPNLPFIDQQSKLHKKKPDLRYPNRKITSDFIVGNNIRKYPQLVWHCIWNHVDHVETLLEKGADVNLLSDTHDSALIVSIMEIVKTGDKRCFNLIKKHPHHPEGINAVTEKYRRTALLMAVDSGCPDVVRTVLELGANVDQQGLNFDLTALHHCLECIRFALDPEEGFRYMMNPNPNDPVFIEAMRRTSGGLLGVTDEQIKRSIIDQGNGEKNKKLKEQVVRSNYRSQKKRFQYDRLIEIAHILLKHGANPNRPSRALREYTPLLLAAELDEVELFNEMIRKGGDVKQVFGAANGRFPDCMEIAKHYNSTQVMGALSTCEAN